jgi:hypothetical protein
LSKTPLLSTGSRRTDFKHNLAESIIRRSLEKDIRQDPVADAKAFFERLKPLESFAHIEPETYVRKLRDTSRLIQAKADDA